MGNYEERKIANYKNNGVEVDTCYCSDTEKPIETAVHHPKYNDDKWIIVDYADTEPEALLKHNKWVKKMTFEKLPETIRDICTAGISKMVDLLNDDEWREMKKEE